MDNPGMRLTRNGKLILAKGLVGKEIKFTKVALGDGEFDYATEAVFDLEELKSWRMDLPITAKEVRGDGTVYIEAFLSNAEVVEGFAAREHGLYALEPDTGEEQLYAYRNAGESYDFVPSNLGPTHKNLYWEYIAEIQDAENVTAVLDLSVAYINREDFENHVNAAHPHPNTPNHFDNIAEADYIWGTDHDNHLHKISVSNFKTNLVEGLTAAAETAPVESEQDIIARAKAELGLDANLLLIENPSKPEDLDTFKVKVTSSAENGSLLGLESIDKLKTGYVYIISDGIQAESVRIKSVTNNISGYHARLVNRLSFGYNWDTTYLYRTAFAGAQHRYIKWNPQIFFGGVEANIARTIALDTSTNKLDDFDISGAGYLTNDGYFTLA